MLVKTISLTTIQPNIHDMTIHFVDGNDVLAELTGDQILLLAYLTLAQIWSYYKLVPRD